MPINYQLGDIGVHATTSRAQTVALEAEHLAVIS